MLSGATPNDETALVFADERSMPAMGGGGGVGNGKPLSQA